MASIRLRRERSFGEAEFPLQAIRLDLEAELDFGDLDVPPAAQRRIALRMLRRLLEEAHESDVQVTGPAAPGRRPATPGPSVRTTEWEKPSELDLRIVKSAHRIVQEVAERGVSGRAVLASELIAESDLSAPTVGRLLRGGHPAADYLSRYVRASPQGRTKALDLTPEGQRLASRIRAGNVPV